jgi:hypothetical protein
MPEGAKGFYIGWNYYNGKKNNVLTFAIKE